MASGSYDLLTPKYGTGIRITSDIEFAAIKTKSIISPDGDNLQLAPSTGLVTVAGDLEAHELTMTTNNPTLKSSLGSLTLASANGTIVYNPTVAPNVTVTTSAGDLYITPAGGDVKVTTAMTVTGNVDMESDLDVTDHIDCNSITAATTCKCAGLTIEDPSTAKSSLTVTNTGALVINSDGDSITFNKAPKCSIAATAPEDLVNKGWVDGVIATGLSWKDTVNAFYDFTVDPVGMVDGERRIATITAGDFTANCIYQYEVGTDTWLEIIPAEGDAVYVSDDASPFYPNQCAVYNGGAWVSIGSAVNHSALIGAGTTTHLQIDTAYALSKNPTGFPNRTDSLISFDDGTLTFTIQPAVLNFKYYQNNIEYTVDAARTKQISAVSGLHYVYFDENILTERTDWVDTIISEYVLVALVYWNNVAGHSVLLGDERHGCAMDPDTHLSLHYSQGSAYYSGMTPADFPSPANPDGSQANHAKFSMSIGYFLDEDIKHTVATIALGGVYDLMWLAGNPAWWNTAKGATYPVRTTGVRLQYNLLSGGAWSLVDVTDGNYVLCHVLAANDGKYKFIVGQQQYNNLSAARTGILTEITSLYTVGIPTAEFVFVASVIFQSNNSYTNTANGRIVQISSGINYQDFRTKKLNSTAGTPSSHANLSGLLQDDHTQYAKVVGRTGDALSISSIGGNQLTVGYDGTYKLVVDVNNGGDASFTAGRDIYFDSAGSTVIENTTDSTSLSTGAALVSGGLSVAKKAHVGDDLVLHNITDATKTLTVAVDNTGKATFNASGTAIDFASGDVVNVLNTTDSGGITTGAIVNAGGAGIAKTLNVGASIISIGQYIANNPYSLKFYLSGIQLDADYSLASLTHTKTVNVTMDGTKIKILESNSQISYPCVDPGMTGCIRYKWTPRFDNKANVYLLQLANEPVPANNANAISIYMEPNNNNIHLTMYNSAAVQVVNIVVGTYSFCDGREYEIEFDWDVRGTAGQGRTALFIDGVRMGVEDTTAFTRTAAALFIFNNGTVGAGLGFSIRDFMVFSNKLHSAELSYALGSGYVGGKSRVLGLESVSTAEATSATNAPNVLAGGLAVGKRIYAAGGVGGGLAIDKQVFSNTPTVPRLYISGMQLDADYSSAADTVPVISGSVTVVDNRIKISGNATSAKWSFVDPGQTGCMRWKYASTWPSLVGSSLMELLIPGGGNSNRLALYVPNGTNNLKLLAYDASGVAQVNDVTIVSAKTLVSLKEYEFEFSWDFTNGHTAFFIDGVRQGDDITTTFTRGACDKLLLYNATVNAESVYVRDLVIYPDAKHSGLSSYTLGDGYVGGKTRILGLQSASTSDAVSFTNAPNTLDGGLSIAKRLFVKDGVGDGLVMEKQLVSNVPFGANMYVSGMQLDADFTKGPRVTATTSGTEVALDNCKIKLRGNSSTISWKTGPFVDAGPTGCLRYKWTPKIASGTRITSGLVGLIGNPNTRNTISIYQQPGTQNILYSVYGSASDTPVVSNRVLGAYDWSTNTEYEIEFNWDYAAGKTALYINGTRLGGEQADIFARGHSESITFDNGVLADQSDAVSLRDVVIFSDKKHSTNATYVIGDGYSGGKTRILGIESVSTANATGLDNAPNVFRGGASVQKDLYTGGALTVASTAPSTSKDTGCAVFEGGIGLEGDIFAGGMVNAKGLSALELYGAVGNGVADDTAAVTSAIAALGKNVIHGKKNVYKTAALSNPLGSEFDTDCWIYNKPTGYPINYLYNPKAINQPIFNVETMYGWYNKLVCNNYSELKIILSGDSTTQPATPTDTHIDKSYSPEKMLQDMFTADGYRILALNRGHQGATTVTWDSTYVASDLLESPDVYVVRWGINDADASLSNLPAFATALRSGLLKVRTAYPISSGVGVILMVENCESQSATVTDLWCEEASKICRQAAYDYACAYFDTYSIFQNGREAYGNWILADGNGAHPLNVFNTLIFGELYSKILCPQFCRTYKPNSTQRTLENVSVPDYCSLHVSGNSLAPEVSRDSSNYYAVGSPRSQDGYICLRAGESIGWKIFGDSGAAVTYRFSYTPLAAVQTDTWLAYLDHPGYVDLIYSSAGQLRVRTYDSAYGGNINTDLGAFSFVTGTEYEFELNTAAGKGRLFVNGVQFGPTIAHAYTRGISRSFRVGGTNTATIGKMRNIYVFPYVVHEADFTPTAAAKRFAIIPNSGDVSIGKTLTIEKAYSPAISVPTVKFYASFATSTSADFTAAPSGNLAGAYGGIVSISGGKLVLGNSISYISYESAPAIDDGNLLSVRFLYTPNYNNAPAQSVGWLNMGVVGSGNNLFSLRHNSGTGTISLFVYNTVGTGILNQTYPAWLPTSGTEYEILYTLDGASGASELFIDGTQHGSTSATTWSNRTSSWDIQIGSNLVRSAYSDFAIRKFAIYDAPPFTANYTKGTNYTFVVSETGPLTQLDVNGTAEFEDVTVHGTLIAEAPTKIISTTADQLTVGYDGTYKLQVDVNNGGDADLKTGGMITLTAAGGTEVASNLKVTTAGVLTVDSTAASTSKDTGCAVFQGGIGVEKTVTTGCCVQSAGQIIANNPVTPTFHVSGMQLDADFSPVSKTATVDGATIVNDRIQIYNASKSIKWPSSPLIDAGQQGTARWKWSCNVAGGLPECLLFYMANSDADLHNIIQLLIEAGTKKIKLSAWGSDGVNKIGGKDLGTYAFVAGQEYDFEFDWDFTNGKTNFYIDGVRHGTNTATIFTRVNSDIIQMNIGAGGGANYMYVRDLTIYPDVKHSDVASFVLGDGYSGGKSRFLGLESVSRDDAYSLSEAPNIFRGGVAVQGTLRVGSAASTSKDTGCAVFEGGIGVEKAVNAGTSFQCLGQVISNNPAPVRFYLSGAQLDADYSPESITHTKTANVAIDGCKIKISAGSSSIYYANSAVLDSGNTGCIRYKITPTYTGFYNISLFNLNNASGNSSALSIYQESGDSDILMSAYDNTSPTPVQIINGVVGQWTWVANQEYEIEFNWNFTAGNTELYRDGVRLGVANTQTLTRTSTNRITFNTGVTGAQGFSIRDVIIFPAVQHTGASYTLGDGYVGGKTRIRGLQTVDRALASSLTNAPNIFDGGVAIQGNLRVGSVVESTSQDTGSTVFSGGIGVQGNIYNSVTSDTTLYIKGTSFDPDFCAGTSCTLTTNINGSIEAGQIKYTANNGILVWTYYGVDPVNAGCIRFTYKTNWAPTGIFGELFYMRAFAGSSNQIYLGSTPTNGPTLFTMKTASDTFIANALSTTITWVANKEYEIEIDWDGPTGYAAWYLDGVRQQYVTGTPFVRTGGTNEMLTKIANHSAGAVRWLKDIRFYNVAKHTGASYLIDGSEVTTAGSASFNKVASASGLTANSLTDAPNIFKGGVAIAQNLRVGSTTSCTSKDTGGVILEGGLGVEENIYTGGTINAIGITSRGGAVAGDLRTTLRYPTATFVASGHHKVHADLTDGANTLGDGTFTLEAQKIKLTANDFIGWQAGAGAGANQFSTFWKLTLNVPNTALFRYSLGTSPFVLDLVSGTWKISASSSVPDVIWTDQALGTWTAVAGREYEIHVGLLITGGVWYVVLHIDGQLLGQIQATNAGTRVAGSSRAFTTNDICYIRDIVHCPTIQYGVGSTYVPGYATSDFSTNRIYCPGLRSYPNNGSAIIGGLAIGDFYRNAADPDVVCVVH